VKERFDTPGSLVIMAAYLGLFFVSWLASFIYLGLRWAIS
jgi:hypothetical protein